MVALEVAFLVVFWSWVFCALLFLRNTVLPHLPVGRTPDLLQLPFETIQFSSTDGVPLQGWIIASDPAQPWIILCHGLGSDRSDLLEIAAGLHRARFNLLLFDFRGHGGSAGRVTSFGWWEQRDVEGALAFLGAHPDIPPRRYGVYGISMGAAVALMAAANDERIGAVAADSPYTDLEASLHRHVRLMYPLLPTVPFHWFVLSAYRLRFGVWPGQVSALERISQLSPRPVLLIQGANDPRMTLAEAKQLFGRAAEPKQLWVIEGAGHLEGFSIDPEAYLARVASFFHAHL